MAIQFISDIHCGMFQIFIWLLSTIFESRIVRISEVVRYLNLLLQVINLYFERFNIEEHPDCSYDFLQINDGSSASANPIGKYCGSNPPANITSTHDTLYIWFFSDISVNGGGFKILWNARDPGELTFVTSKFIIRNSVSAPWHVCEFPLDFDELVNEYYSRCQKKVQEHLMLYFSGMLRLLDVITLCCWQ